MIVVVVVVVGPRVMMVMTHQREAETPPLERAPEERRAERHEAHPAREAEVRVQRLGRELLRRGEHAAEDQHAHGVRGGDGERR